MSVDVDPILSCPFCGQEESKVVEQPAESTGGITISSTFRVKCDWCDARGPTSRDAHRAVGTWNYVSRAVKNDRGIS